MGRSRLEVIKCSLDKMLCLKVMPFYECVAKGIDTIVGKAGVGIHPVARGVENEETKERKGKSILLIIKTKAFFVCSGIVKRIMKKTRIPIFMMGLTICHRGQSV